MVLRFGQNKILFFERKLAVRRGLLDLPTTLPASWQEARPLPRSTLIQGAVADIIGAVPDDKHVVVVATATFYGAKLAAMVRGPQGFSFIGWVGYEFGGTVSGGAELRFMR